MKTLSLILSVLIAQSAGLIGAMFTSSSVHTWFETLSKPAWNPPNWVFGPVWITLYTLIGVASYLVWKQKSKAGTKRALIVYGVHLIFNTLWSIIFFGFHKPGLAFLEIIALLAMILITTTLFWKIDKKAGTLMIPYIAWVSFAAFLNYIIWQLN